MIFDDFINDRTVFKAFVLGHAFAHGSEVTLAEYPKFTSLNLKEIPQNLLAYMQVNGVVVEFSKRKLNRTNPSLYNEGNCINQFLNS